MPAFFNSRSEAEKAAKSFNCTGAHKMGNKWMPCATHEAHENSHDKNPQDFHGKTPLHEAARNGHLSVCQLIV